MAIATVIMADGSIKPLKDAEKEAALDLYHAWKHNKPANDKQAMFIKHVRKVILPPSWKLAAGIVDDEDRTELFHSGIIQGKNSALPTGDQ